jgi:hypothetical protein
VPVNTRGFASFEANPARDSTARGPTITRELLSILPPAEMFSSAHSCLVSLVISQIHISQIHFADSLAKSCDEILRAAATFAPVHSIHTAFDPPAFDPPAFDPHCPPSTAGNRVRIMPADSSVQAT